MQVWKRAFHFSLVVYWLFEFKAKFCYLNELWDQKRGSEFIMCLVLFTLSQKFPATAGTCVSPLSLAGIKLHQTKAQGTHANTILSTATFSGTSTIPSHTGFYNHRTGLSNVLSFLVASIPGVCVPRVLCCTCLKTSSILRQILAICVYVSSFSWSSLLVTGLPQNFPSGSTPLCWPTG